MVLPAVSEIRHVPYSRLVTTLQTIEKATSRSQVLRGYATEERADSPFVKRRTGGIDPAQVRGGSPLPGLQRLSRLSDVVETLEAFQPTLEGRQAIILEEIQRRKEEAPEAYRLLKNLGGKVVGRGWIKTFADQAEGYYPPEEGELYAHAVVMRRRPLSEPVLTGLEWVATAIPREDIVRLLPSQVEAQRHVLALILGRLGRRGETRRELPRGQSLASLYTVLSHLVLQRGAEGSFANAKEESLFHTLLQYSGAEQGNLTEATRQVRFVIERLFADITGEGSIIARRGSLTLVPQNQPLVYNHG